MEEKRKHPRFDAIHLSYICLDKEDKVLQQAMGRTLNISEGGFLLETHFKMKKGYTLIATIGLDDEAVDLKGRVVHCRSLTGGKYVTGVEITAIEGDDMVLWNNFIKKVYDEPAETDSDK